MVGLYLPHLPADPVAMPCAQIHTQTHCFSLKWDAMSTKPEIAEEIFWEVMVLGIILTTSSIESQVLCRNVTLAPHTQYTSRCAVVNNSAGHGCPPFDPMPSSGIKMSSQTVACHRTTSRCENVSFVDLYLMFSSL